MMKQEFEALAGYEVSTEDYNNIIEPMYLATDLSKQDFVKTISKKRFAVKKENRPALGYKAMGIANANGYEWTPNGCWRFVQYVAVEDIDIKTGRYVVRKLTEAEADELKAIGRDLTMTSYNELETWQCIDKKHHPVSMTGLK